MKDPPARYPRFEVARRHRNDRSTMMWAVWDRSVRWPGGLVSRHHTKEAALKALKAAERKATAAGEPIYIDNEGE